MDVIRVQIQIDGGRVGLFAAAKRIATQQGVTGYYAGLSAGIFRQLTYGLARFGTFTSLEDTYKQPGKPLPFYQKILFGMTAGFVGSICGNPAEVALVRMSADGKMKPEDRRNYKNVVDALLRVRREEGVKALGRGLDSNILRNVVFNAAQLGSFSQSKDFFAAQFKMKDGIGLQFAAANVAGLAATLSALPMDTVKSRVQQMKAVNGVMPYTGALDCAMKLVKNEGFFALWKGFAAFYIKIGPHSIISLMILDQLKAAVAPKKK
jgi:solute carrier family 25 oxoglutarate transporter 11